MTSFRVQLPEKLISVVKKSGRNGAEDLNVSAKRLAWRNKKKRAK